MRTIAIDRQLAEEHEQLASAKAAAAKAADLLAQDPSNRKHRIAMVQAQQAVAEVQVGIDALDAARAAAVKFDASEEARAMRAKRAATVALVNGRHAEVVAAAKAADAAIDALTARLGELRDGFRRAHDAAIEYVDLNETDPTTRTHHVLSLIEIPTNIAHSVFLGLHKLAVASGLDLTDLITFNAYSLTHASGVGGVQHKPVEVAAARNAARVASTVREIEKLHQ